MRWPSAAVLSLVAGLAACIPPPDSPADDARDAATDGSEYAGPSPRILEGEPMAVGRGGWIGACR